MLNRYSRSAGVALACALVAAEAGCESTEAKIQRECARHSWSVEHQECVADRRAGRDCSTIRSEARRLMADILNGYTLTSKIFRCEHLVPTSDIPPEQTVDFFVKSADGLAPRGDCSDVVADYSAQMRKLIGNLRCNDWGFLYDKSTRLMHRGGAGNY